MGIDLPLLWALIILFAIGMYIVMDGFDLGVGMLFPFFPEKSDRDVMMDSVAPVWDGNETWLVLGGAGLLAAFPLAYAVVLSALYLPLVAMLIGLVFRGVAFEFRANASDRRRPWWDLAFAAGSYAAAFFQGVTLGAYLGGLPVENGQYAGTALAWLTPFSMFTGLGLVVAYMLLGSTWLVMKSEGELQQQMRYNTRRWVWALIAVIAIVSVWTPLMHDAVRQRWFSMPNFLFFMPVPLLVILSTLLLLRSLRRDHHVAPFLLTLALVFLGYSGLGISLWPNVIPPDVSIREAAGPDQSLGFALVGALFIMPFVLMYTAIAYWVFRGKVRPGEGYH